MRSAWTLLIFLPLCRSISWVYAPSKHKESPPEGDKIPDGPVPAEVEAILQGSRSLEAYSRKPDCFRRAAARIQARCGDLETDESERVNAALSMTLCEIATAEHYSPPLECAPFQTGTEGSYEERSGQGAPGKCVSALSRSAQYWSSYSGYLREVSQLCFAFQRWNEIDTARDVHRNATLETLNVLRHMSEREKRMAEQWAESSSLLEDMRSVMGTLHASAASIDTLFDGAGDKFSLALAEMIDAYKGAMLEMHQGTAHVHEQALSEMNARAYQAFDQLSIAVNNVTPTVERLLSQYLDTAYLSLEQHMQSMAHVTDQAATRFFEFEQNFSELQHVARNLVIGARQASADMEKHLLQSHAIQAKQLEIASAADNVSLVLSELVVKAQSGILDLNGTISDVKLNLEQLYREDWSNTLWSWIREIMIHTFHLQPAYFDRPLFQVISGCLGVLRVAVVFASSVVTALVVLVTSGRNWMARPLRDLEDYVDSGSFLSSPLAFLGTSRARTKIAGSTAGTRSLDSIRSDRAPGSDLVDLGSNALHDSTTLRRRTRVRLSRIPDRLCRPL